jgi:hypothetical protein
MKKECCSLRSLVLLFFSLSSTCPVITAVRHISPLAHWRKKDFLQLWRRFVLVIQFLNFQFSLFYPSLVNCNSGLAKYGDDIWFRKCFIVFYFVDYNFLKLHTQRCSVGDVIHIFQKINSEKSDWKSKSMNLSWWKSEKASKKERYK